MKKKTRIIYISSFFAICSLPLILKPFAGDNVEIEKRDLTPLPSLTAEKGGINNDFSTQFESYTTDRLPLRAKLLSAAGYLKGELLHSPASNVICGDDGWLFFNDEKQDYMNTNALSDRDVKAVAVTLSLIQEQIRANGGRFTFVPMPNKSSIYGEYMPACYSKADENNLSRISDALRTAGVNFVDMQQIMTEQKQLGLYHKRDTHWNYMGALIGYNAIMDSLGAAHQTYDGVKYVKKKNWRADLDKLLYPSGGFLDEQYYFQIEYDPFRIVTPPGVTDPLAQLTVFMSDKEENDLRIAAQSLGTPQNDKLYMVRDSFGRALLPFMIDNYKSSQFVRTDTPDLTQAQNGTDMIYEIVERNLRSIIGKTPFMFAPERDAAAFIAEESSEAANIALQNAGYANIITGRLPDDAALTDARVYIRLQNGSETRVFEAFPISEPVNNKQPEGNCFTAFLNPQYGLAGDYAVSVITGNRIYDAGQINFS
ncbi:MAG: hypothetical protein MJ065_09370 [Oscillospiraceae bacterium]|nr:hypothetical protein [Oscillospiraceae bacterium]